MKGTYGIVGHAGGVNLLNGNLHTVQTQKLYWLLISRIERKSTYRTNAEAVLVVNKQDGVDVNMKTN